MNTIVLVTGPRVLTDRRPIRERLKAIAVDALGEAPRSGANTVTFRHGRAPSGVDRSTLEWVADCRAAGWTNIREDRCPATWTVDGRKNPLAGFHRNETMILRGGHDRAGLCVGWIVPCARPGPCQIPLFGARITLPPGHGTHGTTHCLMAAAAAGIEVRTWRAT